MTAAADVECLFTGDAWRRKQHLPACLLGLPSRARRFLLSPPLHLAPS